MKVCCAYPILSVLLAAAVPMVGASGEHGGEDGHSCACEAEEFGFEIDCSKQQPVLDALSVLSTNNCETTCSSDVCHKNFLIVQAHHDFCLHDDMPESVEQNFHDYEEACEEQHCSIKRRRDPGLPDCPEAVCDKTRGDFAYAAMITANCETDCSPQTCQDNYKILRVEHDDCADGGLGDAAEKGIHNMEEACEAYGCNSLHNPEEEAEQLECHHHAHQCACEADEFGFDISCSEQQPMLDAFNALVTNNCEINCSPTICHKSFLIVQTHHDHCLHDEVPESVEEGIHTYEKACEEQHCSILRKRDPDLPNCPPETCAKDRGNDAYAVMLQANCEADCSPQTCQDNYKILRVEHDNCPDGTLDTDAEEGIHNLEEVCEAYNCNTVTTAAREAEQRVCQETAGAAGNSGAPVPAAFMGRVAAVVAVLGGFIMA